MRTLVLTAGQRVTSAESTPACTSMSSNSICASREIIFGLRCGHPKAFADDDPQNMVLADAMGVVMGTSHHEEMMRAQDEWHPAYRPRHHRRQVGLHDQMRQTCVLSGAEASSE